MSRRRSKGRICQANTLLGLELLLVFALLSFGAVQAGEIAPADAKAPIHITSDKLVIDNDAHTAVFSHNVKAVQQDTTVTADRLIIVYQQADDKNDKQGAVRGDNIDRIEAYGHVRIEFDNRVAVSEQVIYITAERKLVLSGPGSKVTSGQDEVVGDKITFFRNDGRVKVESDGQNQVKAVIHSDQRGLN